MKLLGIFCEAKTLLLILTRVAASKGAEFAAADVGRGSRGEDVKYLDELGVEEDDAAAFLRSCEDDMVLYMVDGRRTIRYL